MGHQPGQGSVNLSISSLFRCCSRHAADDKVTKIQEEISVILSHVRLPVKALAMVVGMLQAGVRMLEQPVRVCTRALYRDIDPTPTLSWNMRLSEASMEELKFWQENLLDLNEQIIRINHVPVQVDSSIAYDASKVGLYLGNTDYWTTLICLPFSLEEALEVNQ